MGERVARWAEAGGESANSTGRWGKKCRLALAAKAHGMGKAGRGWRRGLFQPVAAFAEKFAGGKGNPRHQGGGKGDGRQPAPGGAAAGGGPRRQIAAAPAADHRQGVDFFPAIWTDSGGHEITVNAGDGGCQGRVTGVGSLTASAWILTWPVPHAIVPRPCLRGLILIQNNEDDP